MMKIVILGSGGQLGWEFKQFLENKVEVFSFTHAGLDVTNLSNLNNTFRTVKPDIVINCAAYTKVDDSERNPNIAFKVNVLGSKNVSYAAFEVGAKVIYISTDYVFDGRKASPYTEFDTPNPLSIYGKSKYLGEIYTKEFNPNHLILRVSWLYGINGYNFVKTIIKLANEKNLLKVVNDQFGTPTYTLDVVKQTWLLIQNDAVGIYHSSNEGKTTWFDFAKLILKNLNINIEISPITTDDFPTLAKRPQFSVLDNYFLKLENVDIMRPWKEALNDFVVKYREELLNKEKA